MNQLQNYKNISDITSRFKASSTDYTLSLLREAVRIGVIDENEETALKSKIFDGLAFVIDEFTEGKSSSLSNDKANELLSSLLYNIDAYLISLKNPEKALEEVKEKTVKFLYDSGGASLKRVMADCTALMFKNKQNRLPGGSEDYNKALDEDIRAFSKTYSIRFGAHRNPVIPRYKTALNPRGSGVVRLKKYLTNLLAENLFCRCYDSEEVKTLIGFEMMRANEMESNIGNLYIPVLRCAIICQFLMPGNTHVLLSEDDVRNAEALLEDYTPEELQKILSSAFSRLPSENMEYHTKVFENELPHLIQSIKHNKLKTLLAYLPKPTV